MKKEMIFSSLLFPIALLIFLNSATFAQKVNASILFADAIINSNEVIVAEPDRENNQFKVFLISNADQSLYASDIKANEDDQAFVDLNRKYYWKVIDNNIIIKNHINSYNTGNIPVSFNFLSEYNLVNQDSTKNSKSKEFYLEKSKDQKGAAWLLLITGSAMVIVGSITFAQNYSDSWGDKSEAISFPVLLTAGLIVDLITIPIFISASKNKKKASSISFGLQNNPFHNENYNLMQSKAAVTYRIKF